MENNTITIHLENNNDVILNTSNPDINNLVKAIVNARDTVDTNAITVTSAIDDFDVDGFTNLIKDLVSKYKSALHLENTNYEDFKNQIERKKNLEGK